jgi:hypothetical protein
MRRLVLRPRRVARIVALSALGAAMLLAGPLTAKSHAGTYTATECSSVNTYSAAHDGEYGHHFLGLSRDCRPGAGGLSISLPQAYWAWGYARWTINAPPGTHIVTVAGAQQGVNADGWYVDLHACTPSDCGANIYVSGDGYWRPFGSAPGSYSNWYIEVVCGIANCYGSTATGAHVRDVTMAISDDAPPTVGLGQASELLNGEIQRGAGRIDVSPADVGAGLTSAYLLVNDQQVGRHDYGCGGTPMQPCPGGGSTVHFDLDTQAAPFHDGVNTVRACAADFGSPPNVACTHTEGVDVDNSCESSAVPGGAELTARFARNDGAITVRSRESATVTGQLTDQAGGPVGGAKLCLRELTLAPGERLADVGTVKTGNDGRYRYTVAPGPSRDVQVGYRYRRRQLQRDLHYYSRAVPSLKIARHRVSNGQRIRLYGAIPGPRREGRVVVLQARYPGKAQRWKTFQKARTDRFGRYVAGYRFTSTYVTTEYAMRAVVPAQNGYPFKSGHSRPRPITVIGG